mmetsp:Transcript_29051/g.81286  ORF Transcript_29051/g.81286 Transcript_29051/m.81286 type:complete len:430 (+) Transcript_29051:171-1460(+)|eukprot:CAMPEP_0119134178 /NCGR_PEP_ID=MMETSP1310-20130426/15893_1 /TAXON_ID=464262 /ORGANISM="Genus nov. species nov., Strain RCC2339" /LENGTH=429 /DNA_ID=CAMNT_0007124937 /DNA_START=46 /DNA_END=1335 /DNA_ORIENTATION=+
MAPQYPEATDGVRLEGVYDLLADPEGHFGHAKVGEDLRSDEVIQASRLIAAALARRRQAKNFCAGPAHIPTDVMLQLCVDMLDYEDTGIGIHEMSHRDVGGPVQNCMEATCNLLKQLLAVPDNYELLLMQGGAHAQFAAVAMNLLRGHKKADYIDGGFWSDRARTEAAKYCDARLVPGVRKNAEGKLEYIPPSEWDLSPDAGYVHICANETISGLEFLEDPELPDNVRRPLVGDFTSTLLSRPVDISKYGCIYASGGKNLGPAGICVVIVRKDLIGHELPITPNMMSYAVFANTSPIPNVYNTPPLSAVRAIQLCCKKAIEHGGLSKCEERAVRLSTRFYKAIADSNGFYSVIAAPKWGSRTTIPFRIRTGDKELEDQFFKEAEAAHLHQTYGHHTVGGLRVCMYNAVPEESVTHLISFMEAFQARYNI